MLRVREICNTSSQSMVTAFSVEGLAFVTAFVVFPHNFFL